MAYALGFVGSASWTWNSNNEKAAIHQNVGPSSSRRFIPNEFANERVAQYSPKIPTRSFWRQDSRASVCFTRVPFWRASSRERKKISRARSALSKAGGSVRQMGSCLRIRVPSQITLYEPPLKHHSHVRRHNKCTRPSPRAANLQRQLGTWKLHGAGPLSARPIWMLPSLLVSDDCTGLQMDTLDIIVFTDRILRFQWALALVWLNLCLVCRRAWR